MEPKKHTTRPAAAATVTATTRVTRSAAGEGRGTIVPAIDNPERRKKRAKTTTTTEKEAEDPPEAPPQPAERTRTIIIEYCEQHKAFKKRAIEVEEELEMRLEEKELEDRFKVVVNPVEPREGRFEVREEGRKIFESMQGLTGVKAIVTEDLVVYVLDMINRSNRVFRI